MEKETSTKHKEMQSGTLVYSGRHPDYQENAKPPHYKRYVQYEQDKFSPYQNFLYKQALFGLTVYTEDQLKKMAHEETLAVKKLHEKAQMVINLWKQQIVNKLSNKLFRDFFPDSELSIQFRRKFTFTDPSIRNTISLKSLRIGKEEVVEKLIREKVLPQNFYELTKQPKKYENKAQTV